MTTMTKQQAYLAMFSFLEREYKLTKSEDIGELVFALSLLPDGSPVDPAVKLEWDAAIMAIAVGSVDATLRLTLPGEC